MLHCYIGERPCNLFAITNLLGVGLRDFSLVSHRVYFQRMKLSSMLCRPVCAGLVHTESGMNQKRRRSEGNPSGTPADSLDVTGENIGGRHSHMQFASKGFGSVPKVCGGTIELT